jgi:hypothetical protein
MCSEVTAHVRTARESHGPDMHLTQEPMFAKEVSESLIHENHPPICQKAANM